MLFFDKSYFQVICNLVQFKKEKINKKDEKEKVKKPENKK